jgi:hypothetical protein
MYLIKQFFCIVIVLFVISIENQLYAQLPLAVRSKETISIEINVNLKKPSEASKYPLYAGETMPAIYNSSKDGGWEKHNQTDAQIWQMEIKNQANQQLVFYFKTVKLNADARLYVYSTDFSTILGPYTAKDINDSMPFVVGPISGSSLLLQLEKSTDSFAEISLNEIGVLQKESAGLSGFGTSGDCQVNVNCFEGQQLYQQKQGVARILLKQGSGLFYCSGTLINNTRRDFKPLFLTANHCGQNATAEDYQQWLFHCNYESETCENPLIEPQYYSLTGAQVLATSTGSTNTGSDFKLLLLNNDVPATINPYYNGWNSTQQSSAKGQAIHHPDGDIKKISTYNTRLISTLYGGASEDPNEKYWRVKWDETPNGHGVTEGGSSGSPLFDENGLVIGSLTGGLASCEELLAPDYFGKFSFSWDSNGTAPENQLKPWLDPLETGSVSLSGLGHSLNQLIASFTADANELIVGQEVVFSNLSSGAITAYEWSFEGGEPTGSADKDPKKIYYEKSGVYDVRLIVSNDFDSDTLLLKQFIIVRPQLYPNPASDKFYLDFGKYFPEQLDVKLYDGLSREIQFTADRRNNVLVIIPGTLEKGLYILRLVQQDEAISLKVALY